MLHRHRGRSKDITSTGRSETTRWVGYALFGLAVGLATNSLLGPLGTEIIRYRYSPSMINQGIGLDAVALFAVVPICIAAGVLVLRGHRAGPVLAFIPSIFAAYMVPQYVIGPDYVGIDGNNEQFFLFHLALFILAVVVFVGAWTTVDRQELRPASSRSDRRRSLALFGLAAFIALGRWLPAVLDVMSGDPTSTGYLDNPTAFFLIGMLDLGLVFPAAVAAGVGLRRGASWAREASYAVIGFFCLVPAAVAAMAITMQINDDPNASAATTVLLTVSAVVFTLGAAMLYRPMFTQD